MSFESMMERLKVMSAEVKNDRRQESYCRYINIFLEHFGKEKAMLVGSTKDGTRLRTRQDEGDYDYLLISGYSIPVHLLQYRYDLPCYVNVYGLPLRRKIPVDMVDGMYLPTNLLKEVDPLVFKQLKGISELVSHASTYKGDSHTNVGITRQSKPGHEYTSYLDLRSDDNEDLYSEDRSDLDEETIQKLLQEKFKDSPFLKMKGNRITESFGKIVDFIEDIKPKDKRQGMIYQNYGDLLGALEGHLSGSDDESDEDEHNNNFADDHVGFKYDENEHDSETCRSSSETASSCVTDEELFTNVKEEEFIEVLDGDKYETIPLDEAIQTEQKADKMIKASYKKRSRKDFVAVFPLSGRPRNMDVWKIRRRYWPPADVVQSIYDGQFYLAAKPAVKRPDAVKDFCISYNEAEIKLGRALGGIRRMVLLILKAFQRHSLLEFSDILTSYMWKTSLYWVAEKADESVFTAGNILYGLDKVLEYMMKCLCEGYLEHYFIPSNLIAGIDKETRRIILRKIHFIRQDPLTALREFFLAEDDGSEKPIKVDIPSEEIIKKNPTKKRSKKLDKVVKALESFKRGEPNKIDDYLVELDKDESKFNMALLAMGKPALEDMLQERIEEMRSEGRQDIIDAPRASVKEVLSRFKEYLEIHSDDKGAKQRARENLKNVAISCFMLTENV